MGSEQAESGGLTVPINEVEEEMLITSVKSRPIEIPKSEGVVLAMQKFLDGTRALSPSAINRYLECEMRFFFQDIAGVKEPDRVEEQIDARLFGNIFHKAAELIYRPYIGKIMTASTLEAIVNDDALITDVIYKSFKDEYFEGRDGAIEGKNILIEEIIREYLIKLLRVDIDSAPIDLVGMEESFYTTIPIFDNRSEVKVGGLIDRYDVVGGKFRVIDYKSGEAEFIFDTIPSLFDSSLKRRNKAALQTLIYSRAYFDSCRRLQAIAEEDRDVTPGIYQLKSLFADDFSPYLTCKMSGDDDMTYRAVADEFTSELTSLLERIFSLENSFCQTKELDRCSYCTYNQLCKLS